MKKEHELVKYLFALAVALLAGLAIPFAVKLYTSDVASFMLSQGSSTWLGVALIAGFIGGFLGRHLMSLDWSGIGGGPYVYNILEGVVGVFGLFIGINLII